MAYGELELIAKISRAAGRYLITKPGIVRSSQALVTFTFDDVPQSAFSVAAPILQRYNVFGTYYIAPELVGTRGEYWHHIEPNECKALVRQGHEVGAHTSSHIPVQSLSIRQLDTEIKMSTDKLRSICGVAEIPNFSFPYGNVTLLAKLQLQRHYKSCRGIFSGVNCRVVDLAHLHSNQLYGENVAPDTIRSLLQSAVNRSAWIIFHLHDVCDQPSPFGCRPESLEFVLRCAKSFGIDCVTVGEALNRLKL